MRRIKQLMNGRFEYEVPKLLFLEEQIDIKTKVSGNYRGSFRMKSSSDKKIRGFIHTSTPRAQCNIFDFSDTEIHVIYEIDVTGLVEGEKIKGAFTINTDVGEYELPFLLLIEKEYIHSSNGEINTLAQFTKLACKDIQGAYHVFVSPKFRGIFRGRDRKYLSLYDGMSKLPVTYQDLEEFLIGAKQKQPIGLQLEHQKKEYLGLTKSIKETVQILKTHWGFVKIDVVIIGDFIEIDKKIIISDDFIGSIYNFEYIIKHERLHGGKNFGRIQFVTCHETLCTEIVVQKEARVSKNKKYFKLRAQIVQFMNLYMRFRMGDLSLDTWCEKTEEVLDNLIKIGDLYKYYGLFKAQLLFAKGQPEEAYDILKQFKDSKKLLYTPELKAYFLYLTTLYKHDKKHVQEVNEKVYNLYLKNQESWQILWMRLNLDEELIRNLSKRLEAIDYQYKLGCRSRIMHLEAYDIFLAEPTKIKRLTEFEVSVLRWAAKEQLLDKDVVMQIVEIASRAKVFDAKTFSLLKICYEKYPENTVLSAVCSMLIKGNKTEKKYFIWYESAVSQGLRLTKLYEYYMETLEYDHLDLLPIMIRMYFTYNNTLNYKKRAALYANIINNKEQDEDTYLNYRDTMEQFMMEQLATGHINRNLAIVYENFVPKARLTTQMKETLTKTMLSYEVMCDSPKVKSIIIMHHQLKDEQVVSCIDGIGTVQLYTPDYEIILQDEVGRKFPSTIRYYRRPLIANTKLQEEYIYKESEQVGYLLFVCDQALSSQQITVDNMEYFKKILERNEITESFRSIIMKKIIFFYYDNLEYDHKNSYLTHISYPDFVQADRVKFIEVLIMRFMYEEAYELVRTYGYEGIGIHMLIKLASRMVWIRGFEQIDYLTELCCYVYQQGKYDETILAYLTDYYEGTASEMMKIWLGAIEFELETQQLEEKILTLLMFSRSFIKKGEDVFDSYFQHGGKPQIILAYLIHESYGYFIKNHKMKSIMAQYLEAYYAKEKEMDDICYLALLNYYAEKDKYTKQQLSNIQELVELYNYRGLRFAFYKKFPKEVIRPYQILDKIFVEYRTNPAHKVYLNFCLSEENMEEEPVFQIEPMKNLYEGIFSKEFTLFFGDILTYYITEEVDGELVKSEEYTITVKPSGGNAYQSKYERLNQLITRYNMKDDTGFDENLQDYLEVNYLIDNMFTLM